MVIQVTVGNRGTRVQLQHDLVQFFQWLDLAVLDQLRDLVDGNISLGQASGEGQGCSGEQGSQGFHKLLSLDELFKWDQNNCGNLIQT
ncbi:hypothetical protein D3C84_1000260 [compost metagenome]